MTFIVLGRVLGGSISVEVLRIDDFVATTYHNGHQIHPQVPIRVELALSKVKTARQRWPNTSHHTCDKPSSLTKMTSTLLLRGANIKQQLRVLPTATPAVRLCGALALPFALTLPQVLSTCHQCLLSAHQDLVRATPTALPILILKSLHSSLPLSLLALKPQMRHIDTIPTRALVSSCNQSRSKLTSATRTRNMRNGLEGLSKLMTSFFQQSAHAIWSESRERLMKAPEIACRISKEKAFRIDG